MDKVYLDEKKCCGCGACSDKCPVSAITMKYDRDGFLFPVINQNKCVDCGACRKVCDFSNKKRSGRKYMPETYIFQNSDRKESQSGGAFVALSDEILKDGGWYMAVFWRGIRFIMYVRLHPKKETI